ncbi:MAG: acetolactate decarboxylase [Microbacteriaceae bacterium]|jgi:acetolactate decarboxylase|nr:acetolactate decarboxylase [Microbacteriaceae bacterium]
MTETRTFPRNAVFQTSLMSALLDGIYQGNMTIGELLTHGSFGLGTFEGLDGEMIVLDGVSYQMRVDGTVHPAALDQVTPFAVVTNLVPQIRADLPDGATGDEVAAFVDRLIPSPNYVYALRITGTFSEVRTRTVAKQEPPYIPMAQSSKDEPVQTWSNVSGVLGGFRTPQYLMGVSVPGYHVHFVNDERSHGGHVLSYRLQHASIEISPAMSLDVSLPDTPSFQGANLLPDDLAEQIHSTEQHS